MLNRTQKLKIKIISKGVKISDSAKDQLTESGNVPLSLFEYPTTAGISLVLPGDIYVNAHFSGKFGNSKLTLDYSTGKYTVRDGENTYTVNVIPLPSYFDKKNKNGLYYKEVIMSHADRMRINPIIGCSFRCKYCDMHRLEYKKFPLERILEAIDVALEDKNIMPKHLLISGGSPIADDREYLDKIYRETTIYLKKKDIPVDIMLAPRKEKGFLEELKNYGVNALAINLEIYNEEIAKEINPQKAAISRDFYFDFIKRAVEIFGRGKVRSLLIVGLEPIKETLRGVEALAKIGCDPVLSPFIPGERTQLSDFLPPTIEDLENVYSASKVIADKYGVKIGPRCIPCQHNTLAFPDDSGDYFFS
jgi:radical SAM superfamily enzyme YgiQ (UPF0313 family)